MPLNLKTSTLAPANCHIVGTRAASWQAFSLRRLRWRDCRKLRRFERMVAALRYPEQGRAECHHLPARRCGLRPGGQFRWLDRNAEHRSSSQRTGCASITSTRRHCAHRRARRSWPAATRIRLVSAVTRSPRWASPATTPSCRNPPSRLPTTWSRPVTSTMRSASGITPRSTRSRRSGRSIAGPAAKVSSIPMCSWRRTCTSSSR